MINVVVVDDERPAVDELAYLLGRDSRVGTIHEASSGAEALRTLEQYDVHAMFLDIHMPALSGLDIAGVLSHFTRPPAVVFVTADEDCALKAFELAAVDYLLKPVRPERLAESIRRIGELIAETEEAAPIGESITVDQGGMTKVIRRADVRYVQAQGDYARLHTRMPAIWSGCRYRILKGNGGTPASCASIAPIWSRCPMSNRSGWSAAGPMLPLPARSCR